MTCGWDGYQGREQTVMLSTAKHLDAHRARPFAEFTLSEANGLRMTSKGQPPSPIESWTCVFG